MLVFLPKRLEGTFSHCVWCQRWAGGVRIVGRLLSDRVGGCGN